MNAMMLKPQCWLAATIVGLLSGCGGDSLKGTWEQSDVKIALTRELGGEANAKVRLTFGGEVKDDELRLEMDLDSQGLADRFDARGTYAEEGEKLELEFTGFATETASKNATVLEPLKVCLTLEGLGGAGVCLQTPQTNSYSIEDDVLTVTIENQFVGMDKASTKLALKKVK